MKGLDGSPKMSKRSPMSYFTLHEENEAIKRKISHAFTGGRDTVKEQRQLGGVPEICPIYEICLYQFVTDDQLDWPERASFCPLQGPASH